MRSSLSLLPSSSPSTFSIDDVLLPENKREYLYCTKKNKCYKSELLPLLLHLRDINEETILISLSRESRHYPLILDWFPKLRIDSYFARPGISHPRLRYFSSFSREDIKKYNRNVFFYIDSLHVNYVNVSSYYAKRFYLIESWYFELKPLFSLIKFSLPYPRDGIKRLRFLDGTLLIPPFSDRTWTFLVPNGGLTYWDVKEYDGRMAYTNQVLKKKVYLLDFNCVDYDKAYLAFVLESLYTSQATKFVSQNVPYINTKILEEKNSQNEKYSQHRSQIKTTHKSLSRPTYSFSSPIKEIYPKYRNRESPKKNKDENNGV